MQLFQKMALGSTLLATVGFMATTPASAMLVTHDNNVVIADDLQGHASYVEPGGAWNNFYMARNPVPSGYTHGNLYASNDDLNASVTVTELDGVGIYPGAPQAAEGGVDGHTKYLHVHNDGARPLAGVGFSPISSGTIYAEFMMYEAAEIRGHIWLGTTPEDDAEWIPSLRLTPNSGGATGGGWDLNQVGGSSNARTQLFDAGNDPLLHPLNEWFKVGLYYNVVDGGDDTFELLINGVSSGVVTLTDSLNAPISYIAVTNGHDSLGDIFIGSTVPEPASLALLGIGGVLMLRRRRMN